MKNVFISDHPLIKHKMTKLRSESTEPKKFRELVREIAGLLTYEVTSDLLIKDSRVTTPLAETKGYELREKIGLIPILRAGLGMVDGVWELMPSAEVWHIGIFRDEESLKYSEAEVKSPIDGVVTKYFCEPGEAVFPAQPMPRDPVVSIADMERVKIIAHIGEKELRKVREGQNANIYTDVYPGRIFKGVVDKIYPAANPLNRKFKIEITIPNPGYLLKPGTFARVEIITARHKNILKVPKESVLENGTALNVVHGKARAVQVKTGIADKEYIEIREGLREGDAVIVEGNYGLIEGTPVLVQK